jgi:hypothetical protein
MPSKDYLMLRSALGRVSKHATTPMQRLLVLRAQFLPGLRPLSATIRTAVPGSDFSFKAALTKTLVSDDYGGLDHFALG